MMIQNADRCYQVMRRMGDAPVGGAHKTEEFLCTELNGREETPCLLVRVTDTALAKAFTLFLEEKIRDREFTDYLECFQADGAFYAAFRHSLDQSLPLRLQEERCSLRERAQIARGLLEQLLIQNPHPYFAWNGLRPEQITVNRSLDVHWNYHLERVGQFDDCTMQEVCARLQSVLRLLFREEEGKGLYPLLEEYLQSLSRVQEPTYLQIYQSFLRVYEELLQEPDSRGLPRTFAFRLWERMKKFFAICKKVLMVAILLAALLYVVYVIGDDSGSQVMSRTIRQIGELTIP